MSGSAHETLLETLYTEIREGRDREAVQLVINTADEWMYAELWDIGNALLAAADIEQLGVTGAIGVLTALDPVRARTPAREGFIRRLSDYIHRTQPDQVDALLRGLR